MYFTAINYSVIQLLVMTDTRNSYKFWHFTADNVTDAIQTPLTLRILNNKLKLEVIWYDGFYSLLAYNINNIIRLYAIIYEGAASFFNKYNPLYCWKMLVKYSGAKKDFLYICLLLWHSASEYLVQASVFVWRYHLHWWQRAFSKYWEENDKGVLLWKLMHVSCVRKIM